MALALVILSPCALTVDQIIKNEERNITIGMDAFGRLLIVYTWRDDIIRIISARKANKTEVKQYES